MMVAQCSLQSIAPDPSLNMSTKFIGIPCVLSKQYILGDVLRKKYKYVGVSLFSRLAP